MRLRPLETELGYGAMPAALRPSVSVMFMQIGMESLTMRIDKRSWLLQAN